MRPRLVIGASDITEMELRCREIFWIATGFPQSVVICVLRCRIRKAHEMASHPSCSFDRFWRAGTDPQRWMRRLHRPRHQLNVLQLVVAPIERKVVVGPRPANNLDAFFKTPGSGLSVDAVCRELAGRVSLPEAQIEAAV